MTHLGARMCGAQSLSSDKTYGRNDLMVSPHPFHGIGIDPSAVLGHHVSKMPCNMLRPFSLHEDTPASKPSSTLRYATPNPDPSDLLPARSVLSGRSGNNLPASCLLQSVGIYESRASKPAGDDCLPLSVVALGGGHCHFHQYRTGRPLLPFPIWPRHSGRFVCEFRASYPDKPK